MPNKIDKIAIKCEFLNRRVKLLNCQREMIPIWHNEGRSINSIAKQLNVNKRLIQFIIYPERKKKNISDRNDRGGWQQYYDKEDHSKAMKEHREYKTLIFKN